MSGVQGFGAGGLNQQKSKKRKRHGQCHVPIAYHQQHHQVVTGEVATAEMGNNDMFDIRTVHSDVSENHQASQRQQSHFRKGTCPSILKKIKSQHIERR